MWILVAKKDGIIKTIAYNRVPERLLRNVREEFAETYKQGPEGIEISIYFDANFTGE